MSDVHHGHEPSYDEFPYPGYAYWFTHPDHLGVLAMLHGLTPAPAEACRVLELGCGDGGNLLPMAADLPGSRFVGVDASEIQILQGTRRVGQLGLTNLELIRADLRDLGDSLGEFDFVIAHGLLSWIPEDVRVATMALIGRVLAPHGVAMVSYNTYPGWYDFETVRHLMAFHTAKVSAPDERVAQARLVASWYCERTARRSEIEKGALMDAVHKAVEASSDAMIAHDYLAAHHHPFWFQELTALAADHGLAYLTNARQAQLRTANYEDEVAEMLRKLPDVLRQQQYMDFFSNTRFRTTVLCRAEREIERSARIERFADLYVEAMTDHDLWAEELRDRPAIMLEAPIGTIAVEGTPLRISLSHLHRRRPEALDLDTLFELVLPELMRTGIDEGLGSTEEGRAELAVALVRELVSLYFKEVVQLWRRPPRVTGVVGERPRTGPVQRLQGAEGAAATTLAHRHIRLDPLQSQVLARLDGERTVAALRAELGEGVDEALAFLATAGFLLAPQAP